ncbi:nuclear transport factor 2 family protein [Nocardia sp. 2]|uniref:Nuclear transport factor 2 family protein n=2 Tax=Nocardia acididurans TaxID=2802282 RepID=A0ABS1M6C7_9NOCA|nr:nuclear transport factor 2 family protein [Nocardia acididurans]
MEAAEKALRSTYAEWLTALVENDADRLAEFVTADWVFVGERGITPGALFLELVRSGELSHSAMAAVGEPRIRVHGTTAVLSVRVVNTAHYRGQTVEADEWTTDVFILDDGGWRCELTHLTTVAQD